MLTGINGDTSVRLLMMLAAIGASALVGLLMVALAPAIDGRRDRTPDE